MGILWDQRSFRGQIGFLATNPNIGFCKKPKIWKLAFFDTLPGDMKAQSFQKQSPYDTTMVGRDVIIVVTVVIKIVKHILIQFLKRSLKLQEWIRGFPPIFPSLWKCSSIRQELIPFSPERKTVQFLLPDPWPPMSSIRWQYCPRVAIP